MYLTELTGSKKCPGSGRNTKVSNCEDCGYKCAKEKGKFIHCTSGIWCLCLKGCPNSGSYSKSAKQFALITGRVILFYIVALNAQINV